MSLFHILIISVIQGLTEFLPVSSSGHLVLIPKLIELPDQGILMDMAVHIGTLMAVLIYYRRDIWRIALGIVCWKNPERATERRLGIYILLATIPAVGVGLLMHTFLPDGIRDIRVILVTLVLFGIVMGVADRIGLKEREIKDMTLKSALLVGLAQCLALIPGTSRSGITITAGRFLGFKGVDAAKFSFLLSIPATAGAGLLAVMEVMETGNSEMSGDMIVAIALSFLAGIAAIEIMMRWLKNIGLMPFVIYRLALGGILMVMYL